MYRSGYIRIKFYKTGFKKFYALIKTDWVGSIFSYRKKSLILHHRFSRYGKIMDLLRFITVMLTAITTALSVCANLSAPDSSGNLIGGCQGLSTDSLSLLISFYGGKISIELPDTVIYLPASGLSKEQFYRVSVTRNGKSSISLIHAKHKEKPPGGNSKNHKYPAGLWIIAIVIADIALFLFVVRHRKRRKKQKNIDEEDYTRAMEQFENAPSNIILPDRNAIYLFGEVQVLDSDGKDVSGKFSPLIRELFLILLFKTPEGGISSKNLTELLWLHKDDASAKNNRSVNLYKLRSLLSNVGNCRIERISGKWQMLFDKDIYIDYYECLADKLQIDKLSPDRVRLLFAMTMRGNLLPSIDYLWLDKYKCTITDNLTCGLLKYASMLKDNEETETKLQISEIIFQFDSTNEFALKLKCLAYISMNRHYMAKRSYDIFCRVYRDLYGEDFTQTYKSVIS